MGGRRYALSNVARSASTVQLAFQLNGSTGERSATAVQERLPPFASYAGHPSLSLAIALPEEPTLMATVEEGSPTLPTTSTASGGWGSHRLETVQSCCSKQPLVAGPLTPNPPGHHSRADSPSALTKLKQLLSAMTSDAAHTPLPIPTPNALLSLYHTTKANSQLPKLTPAELSSLIALFGSLSLSTPGRPYSSIYAHPWTARIHNKRTCSTFWPLLIELEADKRDLEQTLCDSDHFWFMHAHLAQDVAKVDAEPAEERSLASHSATNHYRAICRTSPQPEIHVPFLQMLLNQPSGYIEAASVISELIERFPTIHPSVLDCLWCVVLEGAASLPTSSQSQLLRAFRSRLASNSEDIPAHPTVLEEAHAKVPTDVIPLFTTEEVVRALVDVLCGAATRLDSRLRACVTHLLATSFRVDLDDTSSINVAWSNLVLLALANRPSTSTTHNSLHFYPSEWQVICVLAQLERLLHGDVGRQYAGAPSSLNSDSIQKIVGSLWTQWLNVKGSESPAPSDLEWAVLGSFLYVAGRTHDKRILALCHDYLDGLRSSASGVEVLPRAVPRQLLAEYISAAFSCGSSPMDVYHWMTRTTEDPSSVVHYVMARIAPTHPILAHELRLTSKDAGISVYEKDIVAIGQQLANHGYLDYALEYVRDSSLALPARMEILDAVIQAFTESPRDPHHANHWDALSNAVLEILPLDSTGSTRAMVTALLLALLDQGKVSHAIPIVMAAIELPDDYLLSADLQKIVVLLVRHRQFELADSLCKRLASNEDVDPAWYEKIVEEMARGGAHRIANRVAERLPPSSSPSQKMLRAAKYRVEDPATTSTLKVQSILSRSDHDDASALLGVQMLVSAKRMKAAREFFEREQHHLTPAGRTAVGNALIHGYFMRTPHSIQVALRVLKDLSANHQFAPDRVTMNILVKGLLQWTEKLDKQGVRTLFDRLILSGYPTGKLYRRGDAPPFNSTAEAGQEGQEAAMPLPKVTTPISFKKHVRPLYKMFIKGMYVRGDVHGARKVVGILKAAQEDWEERKRKRERELKV